ncbi:MAG TPA: TetR/AcrR family transcriptional regulator [Solirubrobacteraceae bacterium]|nr:TetR/AcrR family transcriptional regulator [Solirubrobacteraceae bacterium]
MTEPKRFTSKGLRTRERIVEAAGELFLTQGLAATSLDDVKAAAGISSSQLYHYFDGKSDLLQAVAVRHTANIVAAQGPMLRDMRGLDSLRDWARFVVDNFRSFDCCGGCPLGSLGSEVAEYDELARQAISASLGQWEDVLRAGLTNLTESGVLDGHADPEALAMSLIVALQGGLLLGKIHRSHRPLKVALENAIDYIASFSTPSRTRALAAAG